MNQKEWDNLGRPCPRCGELVLQLLESPLGPMRPELRRTVCRTCYREEGRVRDRLESVAHSSNMSPAARRMIRRMQRGA